MPGKIRYFESKNAAQGPDGARSETNLGATYGKPRKSILSAPSSRFMWGIPVDASGDGYVEKKRRHGGVLSMCTTNADLGD
jgi:hypothetical protein